jgi:cytochrome c peroxidase
MTILAMTNRTLLGVSLVFAFSACQADGKDAKKPKPMQLQGEKPKAAATEIDEAKLAAFQPLPDVMTSPKHPITPEKVEVGRKLFFDKRLSKNQDVSCNSCHDLNTFGVDNKRTSEGHKKQLGERNSPTVYNAAGHFVQFWDGRAADVEEQAQKPITNPVEMACADEKYVKRVVASIPAYVADLKKAFPEDKDPTTVVHVGKAIGAFERGLVTPARWDRFLKGDKSALTAEEKAGFNKFMEVGA